MSSNADSIPKPEADFDGWLNNLINYVDTKTSGSPSVWPIIASAAGKIAIQGACPESFAWGSAVLGVRFPPL
ncbi:MAG: hypothetical protein LBS64_02905 [Spirochaetaceae bacterium]|nr:hypothetical protein [Spirochaetaceae bacterium]